MAENPIAPTEETTEASTDTSTEETTEEKPSISDRLFGWMFNESESDSTSAESDGDAEEGGEVIEPRLPRTPILNQKRYSRGQGDFAPVAITFMTGVYQGQSIELGLSVNEVSISQTANWEELNQTNLKQGLSFKNISPQSISFDVVFHSSEHDISHLAENLKHLQEINSTKRAVSGITPTPPLLMLDIGSQKIFCVCKDLSFKYEHPFTGNKGFQLCTVSLSFQEISTKSAPSSLGRPNTGTPLLEYKETTTEEERQNNAQAVLIEDALFNGRSGQEAKEQKEIVANLIENNQLQDIEELKKLDSETFVNMVFSGGIAPETLKNEEMQKKLQEDLASVYVENLLGLATADPRTHRILKESLLDPEKAALYASELPDDFEETKENFDLIYDVTKKQDFSSASTHEIFNNNKKTEARNILMDLGGRSLEYRQAELFGDVTRAAASFAEVSRVNEYISRNQSDKESLINALSLSSDQQARMILNRSPFENEQQFKEALSVLNGQKDKNGDKISASILYNRLVEASSASGSQQE
jgi:hypothetical protein